MSVKQYVDVMWWSNNDPDMSIYFHEMNNFISYRLFEYVM